MEESKMGAAGVDDDDDNDEAADVVFAVAGAELVIEVLVLALSLSTMPFPSFAEIPADVCEVDATLRPNTRARGLGFAIATSPSLSPNNVPDAAPLIAAFDCTVLMVCDEAGAASDDDITLKSELLISTACPRRDPFANLCGTVSVGNPA